MATRNKRSGPVGRQDHRHVQLTLLQQVALRLTHSGRDAPEGVTEEVATIKRKRHKMGKTLGGIRRAKAAHEASDLCVWMPFAAVAPQRPVTARVHLQPVRHVQLTLPQWVASRLTHRRRYALRCGLRTAAHEVSGLCERMRFAVVRLPARNERSRARSSLGSRQTRSAAGWRRSTMCLSGTRSG